MLRRDALKLLSSAGMLPLLGHSSFTQAASNAFSGKRLLLVELAGANDGLNTLVPFRHDKYHKIRPRLALQENQTIRAEDEFAFHVGLEPLMPFWEKQNLAWVHGLGYPAPNRSHFKSTAIWESGSDGQSERRSGWITHDLEHRLAVAPSDPLGISLVDDISLFNSDSGSWLSLRSPEHLAAVAARDTPSIDQRFKVLQTVSNEMLGLNTSLNNLSRKLQSLRKVPRIPGGELGRQLQEVVKLIRAGVDTPVYRVRLGGFDTHANQLGRHARLMRQLGAGLAKFGDILIQDGEWNNTIIMTYSEFGRRAAENASAGTDHGTAAPHLLMGGAVQGGLHGTHPDLSSLVDDDMVHTMDYRSLYNQVLNDWFSIGDNEFNQFSSTELQGLIKTIV